MESSNAETVVAEPEPEPEAGAPALPQLIMLESDDDAGVCAADGTCD